MYYEQILGHDFGTYDAGSLLEIGTEAQFIETLKFGVFGGIFVLILTDIIIGMIIFKRYYASTLPNFSFRSVVVVGPVIEEAFFRLAAITAIYMYTGSVLIAIILSSLAFAFGHLWKGPWGLVLDFITGVLFSIIFLVGGFFAVVAAHITNNLIVYLFMRS